MSRMPNSLRLGALFLCIGLLVPATAQEAPDDPALVKGSYALIPRSGDVRKGNLHVLAGEGGKLYVLGTEDRPKKTMELVSCWFRQLFAFGRKCTCASHADHFFGVATLGGDNGRVLTFTREEGTPTIGADGSIVKALDGEHGKGGTPGQSGPSYVCQFGPKFRRADVSIYRDEKPTALAYLTDKVELWDRIPGEVIAFAESKAKDALKSNVADRAKFSKDFDLGSYGHVGVRVQESLLEQGDLTDLQKASDRTVREAGDALLPFWLKSELEGKGGGSYNPSIPIAGGVNLDIGFAADASLHYETADQFTLELPEEAIADIKAAAKDPWPALRRASQVLFDAPARVIRIPITDALGSGSDKALAMPLGTHRSLDGNGSLAISAGTSVGQSLKTLPQVAEILDVGAQASVSVHWNVTGDFKVEFDRGDTAGDFGQDDPKNKLVSLKWTKGSGQEIGAEIDAFVGLTVKRDLLTDHMPNVGSGLVKKGVDAGAKAAQHTAYAYIEKAEKYAKVEFDLSAAWQRSKELTFDMCFDLVDPECRTAFEAAIVGDLTKAQGLHAKQEGLPAEQRTLKRFVLTDTLTTSLSDDAKLQLTVLELAGGRSAKTIKVAAEGTDGTKATTTTSDNEIHRNFTLFGKGVHKSFGDEALRRDFVKLDGTKGTGLAVSMNFQYANDFATTDELAKVLSTAANVFPGDAAVQASLSKFAAANLKDRDVGRMEVRGTLTLDEAGLATVLGTSRDKFLLEYGKSLGFDWSPERIKAENLERRYYGEKDGNGDPTSLDWEAYALQSKAIPIWKDIERAQKASALTNPDDSRAGRADALKRFTFANGIDYHAMIAAANIVRESPDGDKHAQIDVALSGPKLAKNGITFARTVGDVDTVPNPDIR